jgi:hypothetical protein
MPSVSKKQHNFMEMKAHDPNAPANIKSVAEDFVQADKGKSLGKLPERVKPVRKEGFKDRPMKNRKWPGEDDGG